MIIYCWSGLDNMHAYTCNAYMFKTYVCVCTIIYVCMEKVNMNYDSGS